MATYAKIGGGSPITRITRSQQQALEQALADNGDFTVVTAMRYWYPTTEGSAEAFTGNRHRQTRCVESLSSLFSCATSGSSLNELRRSLLDRPLTKSVIEIDSWPDHAAYISCLARKNHPRLGTVWK